MMINLSQNCKLISLSFKFWCNLLPHMPVKHVWVSPQTTYHPEDWHYGTSVTLLKEIKGEKEKKCSGCVVWRSRGRGVHVVLGTTDVSVREGSEFRDMRVVSPYMKSQNWVLVNQKHR